VFGVVGDMALASIDGVMDSEKVNGKGPPAKLNTEYKWLTTIRVRGGWLFNPSTLLYVHGGGAWARINLQEIGGEGPMGGGGGQDTYDGWVVGGGIEKKMGNNFSLFVEYSYLDFGTSHVQVKKDKAVDQDNTINLIKLGLNYKFDGLFF
jgi:outer membrane immunogenic protein